MAARTFFAIEPTDTLPVPLVPPDTDVGGLWWFKLDVAKFLASRLTIETTGDGAFRAGLTLMLKAWQVVPAGSLPNDDRALCRLAGVSLPRWRRMKVEALVDWRLCADGRLYHPQVCAEAVEALAEMERSEAKRERERARKGSGTTAENPRSEDGIPRPTGQNQTPQESPPVAPLEGGADPTVKDAGKQRRHLRSSRPATPAPSAPPAPAASDEAIRWRNRLASGSRGLWLGSWGPKPGEPGCFVPAEILAASPWREAMSAVPG